MAQMEPQIDADFFFKRLWLKSNGHLNAYMTFLFVMQNLRKSALKISVNLRENKRSSNPKNTIPQMAQMEPQIDADFFLKVLA